MPNALRVQIRVWKNLVWSGIDVPMPSDSARDLLAKALERRQELAREAASLDALIELYGRILSHSASESPDDEQLTLYGSPTSRALRATETARAIDAARKVILSANKPLKRGDLVRELEKQGFRFPGKDKNKVFGTNLWRSGRFRTIEEEGYWPKDTPLPKR